MPIRFTEKRMSKTEIRITGFGGQGVILCGYLIGKAASIYDNKHATLTQSFGPEARGSACSAQVVVSDSRVLYPYVAHPSIMLAMSHDGYATHKDSLAEGAILLYDEDLVKPGEHKPGVKAYAIPATRFAEELGRKIVSNIVMLGFFSAVTELLDREAVRKAVETSVPKGTEELNLKAFDKGYQYGLELKSGKAEAVTKA